MLKNTLFASVAFFMFSVFSPVAAGGESLSQKAIARASEENKFLFLFFYEKGSDECDRMADIIKQAENKWSNKANFINIDINDSKEREIVQEYAIWRTPVTLVMAPNEVIVDGLPGVVDLDDLKGVFISPKMIEIIGALQQKKIIFLSVSNENTRHAKENSNVVKDVADVLGKSVEVVEVDPKDTKETKLLKQINVKPDINNSIVLLISQTGQIGERFEGKVTKKELFVSFKNVLAQKSGCGTGGGGGGGCGGR